MPTLRMVIEFEAPEGLPAEIWEKVEREFTNACATMSVDIQGMEALNFKTRCYVGPCLGLKSPTHAAQENYPGKKG